MEMSGSRRKSSGTILPMFSNFFEDVVVETLLYFLGKRIVVNIKHGDIGISEAHL